MSIIAWTRSTAWTGDFALPCLASIRRLDSLHHLNTNFFPHLELLHLYKLSSVHSTSCDTFFISSSLYFTVVCLLVLPLVVLWLSVGFLFESCAFAIELTLDHATNQASGRH